MRRTVFGYIEIDYKQLRLHSANGYLSPADHEARYLP
jgi:transposase InsO family protein